MQKRTQVLIPLIDFTIREIEIYKVKSKPTVFLSEHTSEVMAKLSCELEEEVSKATHYVLSYRKKFYITTRDVYVFHCY
jgi:aspartate carbamoyltransferase regulatory subunit